MLRICLFAISIHSQKVSLAYSEGGGTPHRYVETLSIFVSVAKFSLERNQIIDNLIKHFSFSLEASMNNLILYNQSQYRFEGEQEVSIFHKDRKCIDRISILNINVYNEPE